MANPNQKLTCYVLDDEKHMVDLLVEYICQTNGLQLSGFSSDPVMSLPTMTGPDAPDLLFLGMYMNGMYGLEFSQAVKMYTTVIFTTSMPWKVQQIFPDDLFVYLPKPISYEAFKKCISQIRK